jgi:shikimate kinase
MNIVLIGYRGTGKSAVGALLSQRLSMPCIGMDARIVEKAGISIPEIVDRYGWPGFRDMETHLARELAALDGVIVDTGGGIIERSENVAALEKNALMVWLKATVETIVSRIQGDTQRPSLTTGKTFTEEVAEVLEARTPKYAGAARCQIDTDALTPEQIVEIICEQWQKAAPRH